MTVDAKLVGERYKNKAVTEIAIGDEKKREVVVDQILSDSKRVAGSLWKPSKQTAALSTRNQGSRLISIDEDHKQLKHKRIKKKLQLQQISLTPRAQKHEKVS